MESRATLVVRLNQFAVKYKDDSVAAEALMSFFRGDCQHISDRNDKQGVCELCGHKVPRIAKN